MGGACGRGSLRISGSRGRTFCADERLAGRQVAGAGLPTGGLRAGACVGKRFADWQIASWRIAGRGERLASTRGRGGASAAACGCRTFCAEERLAGYRLACCGTTPRFAASTDNLQRFLEAAAKNDASACKTSVASPSTSRNCRSRAQLATKIKQSGAHPCRTAYTRAFFGSKSTRTPRQQPFGPSARPRPLANNSPVHRPDPGS